MLLISFVMVPAHIFPYATNSLLRCLSLLKIGSQVLLPSGSGFRKRWRWNIVGWSGSLSGQLTNFWILELGVWKFAEILHPRSSQLSVKDQLREGLFLYLLWGVAVSVDWAIGVGLERTTLSFGGVDFNHWCILINYQEESPHWKRSGDNPATESPSSCILGLPIVSYTLNSLCQIGFFKFLFPVHLYLIFYQN